MNAKEKKTYELHRIYDLKLDEIQPDPDQPRKFMDEKSLEDLASSIKQHGVLFPILLREQDEQVIIVAGERRYQASKLAGVDTISAIFVEKDFEEIALIENLQRENLNPIDESEALIKLIETKEYKDKDLVPIIGKARSTISEIKKVASLPEVIKKECRKISGISRAVLLEIARQKSEKEQVKLFKKLKKKGLTTDQLKLEARKGSKHKEEVEVIIEKIEKVIELIQKLPEKEFDSQQNKKIKSAKQKLKKALEENE